MHREPELIERLEAEVPGGFPHELEQRAAIAKGWYRRNGAEVPRPCPANPSQNAL